MSLKYFSIILILVFSLVNLHSQTNTGINFDKIEEIGFSFVKDIKEGKIKQMQNLTPPEKMWSYSDLLEYKKLLSDGSKNKIRYGSYIEPSDTNKDLFTYNYFAYSMDGKRANYSFIVVVPVDLSKDSKRVQTFLFTKKLSIREWWMHTFSLYKENKLKGIPDKFKYFTCPPPQKM